ncbi:hypothetical protein CY34DRAFT_327555 [Suillus luteus UH-Slu-Lm8-n1]|uniref:Uncharacterized protein n=1 Tax=Suillus luteus UH-Slu-Lm8-n1 TaxID=930992 RepID=A0A0D0AD01_9AGAM|nr:hypothetical protein CY34DRAFT_327555 [Suillus luteus UH-Slu-Lm8-n1]
MINERNYSETRVGWQMRKSRSTRFSDVNCPLVKLNCPQPESPFNKFVYLMQLQPLPFKAHFSVATIPLTLVRFKCFVSNTFPAVSFACHWHLPHE